jgi:hypothetical protein
MTARPRSLEVDEFTNDIGAGARTRTEDLLITNQLLYQLSYAGTAGSAAFQGRLKPPSTRRAVDAPVKKKS